MRQAEDVDLRGCGRMVALRGKVALDNQPCTECDAANHEVVGSSNGWDASGAAVPRSIRRRWSPFWIGT